jgi:hypothetical protein
VEIAVPRPDCQNYSLFFPGEQSEQVAGQKTWFLGETGFFLVFLPVTRAPIMSYIKHAPDEAL